MIFGDEPRECSVRKKKIYGMVPQTENHVGPGAYFTDSRKQSSLNTRKNHSVKEPMAQGVTAKSSDRSYLISSGILTPLGVAMPGPGQTAATPGPGHYAGADSPQFKPRSSPASSPNPGSMGKSPRLTKSNSILKNGVMFEGSARHQKNSPFGPGHYFVEQDTLNKKSFNARIAGSISHASGGVVSPNQSIASKSPRKAPTRSPLNSPLNPNPNPAARASSQGRTNTQYLPSAGLEDNFHLFSRSTRTAEEYRKQQHMAASTQSTPTPAPRAGSDAVDTPAVDGSFITSGGSSPTSDADEPLTIAQLAEP